VGAARAIVTDVPGTTRDLVTETVEINGLRVTLVDTAGMRETSDAIESEGVARSHGARDVADVILVVLDGSQPLDTDDRQIISETAEDKRLIVSNKSDLPAVWSCDDLKLPVVPIAAKTGAGLDALRAMMTSACDARAVELADRPEISNVRHATLVRSAHDALLRARAAVLTEGGALSEEFVLADLQQARAALEEITGQRTSNDLLAHIFSRFCIGK
jgi:tRNA modification GTPase